MFKRITLIALLLFMAVGTPVFAHAYLEASTPINGEAVKQPLKNGHLSFEKNFIQPNIKNEASSSTLKVAAYSTKKEPDHSKRAYIVPSMVGLLIMIGLGSYWLIFRKKYIL
ncbi:MAG: hypothetical protein Q8934_02025 [Bacillota bacterium]|nr:hypothetical protein [Bacillota bacterium]